MSNTKQIAIIGATASGKSALAIDVAKKYSGIIFSIDSLAIYKEMDIVSAKPSKEEQEGILHLGIDALDVNEHFSAAKVALLYEEARTLSIKNQQPLIIVGGSSFYLKSLMTGLSQLPAFSQETKKKAKEMLVEPTKVHALLSSLDPASVGNIDPNDKYRLEKLLLIYLQTDELPSNYFAQHPPKPVIEAIDIFEIQSDREVLRERIKLRTSMMIEAGLIDEIARLEAKWGRGSASMKAIGVIETLQYLDSVIDKKELHELISIHTSQLAKRQTTFNKTQFEDSVSAPTFELRGFIDSYLKS